MVKKRYAICFGEVLWDLFDGNKQVGGAPLNVCYHLTKMGVASKIISQVGNDQHGKDILVRLNSMGIDNRYCTVSATHPTSTVTVRSSAEAVTYEITSDVAWDYIPVDPQLFTAIQAADVFVYGSLAARSEVSRQSLYTYLKFANWKVFDINLRQAHYTPATIKLLLAQCDMLKVNDEELVLLGNWFGHETTSIPGIVSALRTKFPNIREIILTMGSRGAMYFSDNQQLALPGVQVNVVDTVGCGDSFLAAFVANKLAGKPIEHCLRQAILLSAFVATQAGGCPVYRADEMEAIDEIASLRP